MKLSKTHFVSVGLILIGGLMVLGLFYWQGNTVSAVPTAQVVLPIPNTPSPVATATSIKLPTTTATATPGQSVTPKSNVPLGGVVYSLTPDINSVGWVQANEEGNHFGDSYLYAGLRNGVEHHGALQFDLSFIPEGATIFMAELELTGLAAEGLTTDSSFEFQILESEIDSAWSRYDFEAIHQASVDESLTPVLEGTDLAKGRSNKLVFNAAQRSIIEARLADTHRLSLRIDSQMSEGWFAWDTGFGESSLGQQPALRLGVILPVATGAAQTAPGSTLTPTPTLVIITSTPTPEDLATMVAIAVTATYEATAVGTATPLPQNWVTPWAITATPTPENSATALYQWAEATAAVIAHGTPTPTPQNMVTATPTATATPTPVLILLEGDLPPMTPSPTPLATIEPTPAIPSQLMGMIAFKSDRTGAKEIYVVNPDGSGLALLTNPWPYNLAKLADAYSPDGRFRTFTKDGIRYRDAGNAAVRNDAPAVYWYDSLYNVEEQVTFFGQGLAYGGVWSPGREQIAFVSNDSGDDEIWVVNRDGSGLTQLTGSNEAYNAREIGKDTFVPEINKHPSWSPDGSQLVFWSTRTGQPQIWIMDANGTNPYSLSRTNFSDWDPVWIKYPGIPANAHQVHMPYRGPYDPAGQTRGCTAFPSPAEAQSFYLAAGGPFRDPHELDQDSNGIACD